MHYINQHDIPLPLAVWLLHDEYDHKADPTYISATTLLTPIKAIILSRRVDYDDIVMDISELVSAKKGTAYHDSIEKAWKDPIHRTKALKALGIPEKEIAKIDVNNADAQTPIFIENRSEKKIDGYTITGKYDFIGDGILHDFKSTSAYTWVFGSMDEKYQLQGSIYRWLNPDIIKSDFIRIWFIFTDWQQNLARANKDYPQYQIKYKDIPLLSLAETERYIKQRIKLIDKYKDSDQDLIPRCTDEDLWRSETKYKYYSKPDAARATKVFDTNAEAQRYLHQKKIGFVKEVKGEVKRCLRCPAYSICNQRREYIPDV